MNSLRPCFPHPRTWLQGPYTDIVALQAIRGHSGECRLSRYAAYHSAAQHQEKKSRASVYVLTELAQREVDVSSFSSVIVEYTAMFFKLQEGNITAVYECVQPGS